MQQNNHKLKNFVITVTWKGEKWYKSPCKSHISNIKSSLPVEAEISVTKVFITANMKNERVGVFLARRSVQHLSYFTMHRTSMWLIQSDTII
jgi:hypothetical protein